MLWSWRIREAMRERHQHTRIAHLSDLHILGSRASDVGDGGRSARHAMSMRFVSFGRPLDASLRRRKLLRALESAKAAGASCFVLTGDLTELGLPDQFEALAEVLHASRIDPHAFVLIPGNHDLYSRAGAFADALEGPLRAFRHGAATAGASKLVDFGTFFVAPIDVTFHQPVTRSAGELTRHASAALERRLTSLNDDKRPVLAALHHHPFPHRWRAWQWVDGLRGWEHLAATLDRHPNLHALHGHLHHYVERHEARRIFGTTAVVEDDLDAPARVRLYEVMRDREVGELRVLPSLPPAFVHDPRRELSPHAGPPAPSRDACAA